MTTPRKPLTAVEDARQQLLDNAEPVAGSEQVSLQLAVERVLAEDVFSSLQVPGFDNSAMDGYALRFDDLGRGPLPVSQRIVAGKSGQPLQAGSAARIFTGAPVPVGADAVVMQEQCTVTADGCVEIMSQVVRGQNIRRAGEDIALGSRLLGAGTRLRAQELGLLASIGVASVTVRRRPRVAIFFTGDELVEPGHALASGQIYNSNRYMIFALLQQAGCSVTDLGIVPDELELTRQTLRHAASDHDLVLTCGGVSVGEEDHVKAAVEAEGELRLWQIAIKPGKPLAWGRVGGTHFIGLPGNPVSSFVTFKVLVEPFVRQLAGDSSRAETLSVAAAFDWPRPDKRREYLRVRLEQHNGQTVAVAFASQGSGVLTSCSFAEGLLEVAPGRAFSAGDALPFHPF